MREQGECHASAGVPVELRLPRKVLEDEWAYVRARRARVGLASDDSEGDAPDQLVGVALSGGGIRSATLSLGVLQHLIRRGWMRQVDLLSTVSGGGYIGSCITSLLSRGDHSLETPVQPEQKHLDWKRCERFDLDAQGPFDGHEQLHHLRRHGDFLVARRGLFRHEFVRLLGSIPAGLLTIWLGLALFLVVASSAWLLLLALLLDPVSWQSLATGGWISWEQALDSQGPSTRVVMWGIGLGGLIAMLLEIGLYPLRERKRLQRPAVAEGRGEPPEQLAQRREFQNYAAFLPLLTLLGCLVARTTLRGDPVSLLCAPAAAGLGAWLAIWGAWSWSAKTGGKFWTPPSRSVAAAKLGLTLYVAVGGVALYLASLFLWSSRGTADWQLTSFASSAVLLRLFTLFTGGSDQGSTALRRVAMAVRQWSLVLIVPVFLFAGLFTFAHWALAWTGGSAGQIAALGGGAALLFVAHGLYFDLNRASPHYFYRDRLSEAYLRTDRVTRTDKPGAEGAQNRLQCETLRDDHQLLLQDLHKEDPGLETRTKVDTNGAPYHLLSCAVNMPGSRDLARRSRKSDYWMFSRYWIGSGSTGYERTQVYRNGRTTLAAAMTISGAAAASAMGFHTSAAQAFALTLFNVRLGFWAEHPTHNPKGPDWRIWPLLLARELFASTNARGKYVNLSDGGHTGDNLGIYPLLQRRCKLIVAIDGERDPDLSFPSFSSALRQIYTDENVKVTVDVTPVASGKRHHALGRIEYPALDDSTPAETGVIVVLKSSYIDGKVPTEVRSYKQQYDEFPHQSTADQFFDDDQFEAYRALGGHIAEEFLQGLADDEQSAEEEERQLLEELRTAFSSVEETAPEKGEASAPTPYELKQESACNLATRETRKGVYQDLCFRYAELDSWLKAYDACGLTGDEGRALREEFKGEIYS